LVFGPEQGERVRALGPRRPRACGQPPPVWTLDLAAAVRVAEGLVPTRVSAETIRTTVRRLGRSWERATHADHPPRCGRGPQQGPRDRLIACVEQRCDWALGCAAETWGRRFAPPPVPTGVEPDGGPLRLVEQEEPQDDPDPKALAWYGVRRRQAGQAERVWLRVVDGRPVSASTEHFLDWCGTRLPEAGVRVGVVIWGNASWQVSKRVRAWIRAHPRRVKPQGQGVRLLSCYRPVKSPWLHPIAPQGVHGKRAIVEPA
jgi:hypothetical protein